LFRADVCVEWAGVDEADDPQRTPEGATLLRSTETGRIGVNVRTPTRPAPKWIGDDDEDRRAGNPTRRLGGDRNHPQQLGGWSTTPTTHTGARRGRATYHA
jgi:hypothetical protein